MGTLYGVWFESYLRGGPPWYGDVVHNLFDTLSDAQKGIDTLLWVFTEECGFGVGSTLQFRFDIYEDDALVATVDLTRCIVLSSPHGEQFPLNEKGVIAEAEFPDDDAEDYFEIAGQRMLREEFPSLARPWVDWSRVSFDPTPDVSQGGLGLREGEKISDRPRGLLELLICNQDDVQRVLRCNSAWLTPNVVGIARTIRDSGDVTGLGALADALDEAGCDNTWFPWHLRLPPEAHARGSWVPGYLIEQATRHD